MNFTSLDHKIQTHLKNIFKNEYDLYVEAFNKGSLTSVRYNTGKSSLPEGDKVLWCNSGVYLKERPWYVSDPLYHAGAYYPQEASSMFIDYVVKELKRKFIFNKILDLSAAPGGKSLILSDNFIEDEIIVANEVIQKRSLILKENVTRWGCNNVIVTNNDPEHFVRSGLEFDLVLVDAPCSGEGMFRKEPESISNWSEDNVNLCSLRQRRILADIDNCIAPDGILIYSTCTFNTAENEENIQWLINEHGYKNIKIELDSSWGISQSLNKDIEAYRFYPHKLKGEGLFVSVLQKQQTSDIKKYNPGKSFIKQVKSQEICNFIDLQKDGVLYECKNEFYYAKNINCFHVIDEISSKLKVVMLPNQLGQIKGKDFIPAHGLALQNSRFRTKFPAIELNNEQAIKYLRKENIDTKGYKNGWYLVTYSKHGLGWLKIISPTRQNNYLPEEYRIKKNFN